MRLALAQLDARLGDVHANLARARAAVEEAGRAGADLVVFPELFLSGYALRGVERETALEAEAVAAALPPGTAALVGFHERRAGASHNSAVHAAGGEPLHVQRKLRLVEYAPFEEGDLFAPGDALRAFETRLGRAATLICNDAWQPALPELAVRDGARILLVPACSSDAVPEAEEYWRDLTRFYARMLQCWVVFVNRVGSERGLTFWGGSRVVDPLGELVAEAPRLEEALEVVEIDPGRADERRRELPLLAPPRLDVLRAELRRLADNA